MIVCVLVATAVYDQGVVGVYIGPDAEQKARDAAAEIWPKTDGYHRFRIDKLEVDKTYENVFDHWATSGQNPSNWEKPAAGDVKIEIDDRIASAPPSPTL